MAVNPVNPVNPSAVTANSSTGATAGSNNHGSDRTATTTADSTAIQHPVQLNRYLNDTDFDHRRLSFTNDGPAAIKEIRQRHLEELRQVTGRVPELCLTSV